MGWSDQGWAQVEEPEWEAAEPSEPPAGRTSRTVQLSILVVIGVVFAAVACVAAGQLPRHHPLVPAFAFKLPHLGGGRRRWLVVCCRGDRARPHRSARRASGRRRPIDVHAPRAHCCDGRRAQHGQGRAARSLGRWAVARPRANANGRGRELRGDEQAASARTARAAADAAGRVHRQEDRPRGVTPVLNQVHEFRAATASRELANQIHSANLVRWEVSPVF